MAIMMTKLKRFWVDAYRSDTIAFYLEMSNFFFSVSASIWLAITAANPRMAYIYPLYFVGSTLQCWASIRRGQPWVMLVTAYFSITNVFGFSRAVGWI